MWVTTPDAEVDIDETLVRRLLADQCPELAPMSLAPVGSGWDNTMIRIGADLMARVPRRQFGVDPLLVEQRWLSTIAAALPLEVPAPIFCGRPTDYYPWPWSIVTWAPGSPADLVPPEGSEAVALGRFLKALHVAAPADAPRSTIRGMPLADRLDQVQTRIDSLGSATELITPAVIAAFETALATPYPSDLTWVHGDLHPKNVIVDKGRLSSIIDWGDMNRGDGANDLAAFWMLFDDPAERLAGLHAYGATPQQVARARGWAVFFGALLAEVGLNGDERFLAIGTKTLANLAS